MIVFAAGDNRSLPSEFVDLDARTLDRADVADEVAGQLQAVVFDRYQPVLLA